MDNTVDELKKLVRRTDSIQKSVDILNADRNLLEDILARLGAVEQALHLNKDHQSEMNKDIREEIREVKQSTENKVEEVQAIVEDAALEIKATTAEVMEKKDNMIDKLKKKLFRHERETKKIP